jgi:hypothetical protein
MVQIRPETVVKLKRLGSEIMGYEQQEQARERDDLHAL